MRIAPLLLTLLLPLCSLPLMAATVYRSVDADGAVAFSDTRPTDAPLAQKMHIDTPAPQPDALQHQRLEEMRETTDRMAADRMARERHRAELRELAARAQTQWPHTEPDTIYTRPYRGSRHPFGYYGLHPRPGHSSVRPPLNPSAGHPSAGRPPASYGDHPAAFLRLQQGPRVRDAFNLPRR